MSHSAALSTETETSSVVAEIVEDLFYDDEVVSEDCTRRAVRLPWNFCHHQTKRLWL